MPDLLAAIINSIASEQIHMKDFLLGAGWALALRKARIQGLLDRVLPERDNADA